MIPANYTSASLAQDVIDKKQIIHVPEMQTFLVEGHSNRKYTVQLFPEKCQCPATGTCYHILAAKKSIGLRRNKKNSKFDSFSKKQSQTR